MSGPLDLDAVEARANDSRHVSFPSGDIIIALVAEVRRVTIESELRWLAGEALAARTKAAEARVTAVEAVTDALTTAARIERRHGLAYTGAVIEAVQADLRAVLATTGGDE